MAANASARLNNGSIDTQAIFGSLNTIRDLTIKFKGIPSVIWDGRAQWRYDLYPDYKAKRNLDPNKTPKPYEIAAQKAKESYRQQRPHIVEGLSLLGVRQILPKDDEADDIAGYLAGDMSAKGKKVVVVSRDHDWLQLVSKSVDWYNPVEKELVTAATFQEYTGYEDPMQFVYEKALVGDTSDCINGVQGIGPKCAPALIKHYGTPTGLIDEVKSVGEDWKPPIPELRMFRKKLVDFGLNKNGGVDILERNMKLMCLLNVKKPASIEVRRTDYQQEAFVEFCHEFAFQSILRRYSEWIKPFEK
jgi:5'-3' exonuclease